MALYDLNNDFDCRKFDEKVGQLKKRRARVELKEKHATRSDRQNRYLHVLINYYAAYFGYSPDEVKLDTLKRKLNADIFRRQRVNAIGREEYYMRSTTALTREEMTTVIDKFRNFSASEAGLYLPAPNEGECLFYAEQYAEKMKEFLFMSDETDDVDNRFNKAEEARP